MIRALSILWVVAALLFGPAAVMAADCQSATATNQQHEAAGRAYYAARSGGCGGDAAGYYAVGSKEYLGRAGRTSTTLITTDGGQTYKQGTCPAGPVDQDSDGSAGDVDCNDTDATIHPGATEICGDGIDQDCDGQDLGCIEESCKEWSAGNQEHVAANRAYAVNNTTGCTQTVTYFAVGSDESLGTSATAVTTLHTLDSGKSYHLGNCPTAGTDADKDGHDAGADCNDNDPAIHPGATEICGDGIDQDCNGVDSPCQSTDIDKDGHAAGADCNDNDPAIHPGAAEICGDGIDQDCDGSDQACAQGEDKDSDGFASDQDCDDGNPAIHPGAMDFCDDGIDQDCNGEDSTCLPPPSCITSLDKWKLKYAPQNSNCLSCHTTCTPGGLNGRHSCTEGGTWGSMNCTGCHRTAH